MSKFLSSKEVLNRMTRLCAVSEKCETDIRLKLQKINSNPEDADAIIEYLKANDFINEQRYAECFVRDKFKFNGWGKIKIKAALLQKRISEKNIERALAEIDPVTYEKTLKKILSQKKVSIQVSSPNDLKIKLLRYASGRGFEPEIIFQVLNKILNEGS